MLEYFKEQRPKIKIALQEYLKNQKDHFSAVEPWGKDFLQRLQDFSGSGKMIRGGLIMLANRMFAGRESRAALEAAVAIELMQGAFLIHDDIMDQDDTRRGRKTIYYQYQELGEEISLSNPRHFGRSMGICAGDLAFFLAFDVFNRMEIPPEVCHKIYTAVTREVFLVGLAQMQDIYLGYSFEDLDEEKIISVFRYKTARYTFSLPFYVGAVLAGREGPVLGTLSQIGENLGIIFQIKDDELGLFGEKEETGKPMGSDLRGAKKTLYYLYLLQKTDEQDRERLKTIMGNPQISEDDILWARDRVVALGIKDKVRGKMLEMAQGTRTLIASLDVSEEDKRILGELLEYSLNRNS